MAFGKDGTKLPQETLINTGLKKAPQSEGLDFSPKEPHSVLSVHSGDPACTLSIHPRKPSPQPCYPPCHAQSRQ